MRNNFLRRRTEGSGVRPMTLKEEVLYNEDSLKRTLAFLGETPPADKLKR